MTMLLLFASSLKYNSVGCHCLVCFLMSLSVLAYIFVTTRFEAPYQGGVDLTGCGGGMTGFAKDPTADILGSLSDLNKWKTESVIVYCEATPYGELGQPPYPQNRQVSTKSKMFFLE